MAVDVAALLHDLGFMLGQGAGPRDLMLRSPSGKSHLVSFAPATDRITVRTLRHGSAASSRILFIGRSATPSVIDRAIAGKVDILTEDPPRAIIDGDVFAASGGEEQIPARQVRVRPAWFRWAVERLLVLVDEPLRQSQIAARLGTSQQTVSHAARTLGSLVVDEGHGLRAADRRVLLEHFLKEYPGAGGQQFGWYSLDNPVDQAVRAMELSTLLDAQPLLSGDVAADRIAPWKLPGQAKLYVSTPVDLGGEGFLPAPLGEATLVITLPQDPTLWHLASNGEGPSLADPALVCWDVLHGDDVDSTEASEHLMDHIVKVGA